MWWCNHYVITSNGVNSTKNPEEKNGVAKEAIVLQWANASRDFKPGEKRSAGALLSEKCCCFVRKPSWNSRYTSSRQMTKPSTKSKGILLPSWKIVRSVATLLVVLIAQELIDSTPCDHVTNNKATPLAPPYTVFWCMRITYQRRPLTSMNTSTWKLYVPPPREKCTPSLWKAPPCQSVPPLDEKYPLLVKSTPSSWKVYPQFTQSTPSSWKVYPLFTQSTPSSRRIYPLQI